MSNLCLLALVRTQIQLPQTLTHLLSLSLALLDHTSRMQEVEKAMKKKKMMLQQVAKLMLALSDMQAHPIFRHFFDTVSLRNYQRQGSHLLKGQQGSRAVGPCSWRDTCCVDTLLDGPLCTTYVSDMAGFAVWHKHCQHVSVNDSILRPANRFVHVGIEAQAEQQDQHKKVRKRSSKKAKRQKKHGKKAAHTNINDWSSDDSDDAQPAPLPDQLDPMSDSDHDTGHEAANAAVADKVQSATATARKDSTQRKTGDRKRKGGSSCRGEKQKRSGNGKATDWTSDDSSDAQPAALPDQLDAMSDSDDDKHDEAAAAAFGKAQSTSAKAKAGSPHQKAEATKRKGRLRKARASPQQGQQPAIAADQEAGDVMVDLEDDVPGIDAGPDMLEDTLDSDNEIGLRQSADKGQSKEQQEQTGSKRKSKGGDGGRTTEARLIGDDSGPSSGRQR